MNAHYIQVSQRPSALLARPRVRLVLAIVTALLTVLIAAAPASAYLRDFKVVTGSTPSNDNALKSGLVSVQPCGGVYFGGGAFVTPSLPNLGLTQVMPFGGFLYGAAETDHEAANWSVSARAFCASVTNTPPPVGGAAPYLKGIQIVSAKSSSNSGSVKHATVKCPAGKSVVSGGGDIDSASNDIAFTSLQRVAGGTSWRASAHEVDSTNVSWSIRARAVCANIKTETATTDYVGAQLHQQYNPPLPSSSSSTKTITRTCPAGMYLIGGGARVLGPGFETTTRDVVITRSEPQVNGLSTSWVAEARETDPIATSWTLNAYIACAPLNAGPPA